MSRGVGWVLVLWACADPGQVPPEVASEAPVESLEAQAPAEEEGRAPVRVHDGVLAVRRDHPPAPLAADALLIGQGGRWSRLEEDANGTLSLTWLAGQRARRAVLGAEGWSLAFEREVGPKSELASSLGDRPVVCDREHCVALGEPDVALPSPVAVDWVLDTGAHKAAPEVLVSARDNQGRLALARLSVATPSLVWVSPEGELLAEDAFAEEWRGPISAYTGTSAAVGGEGRVTVVGRRPKIPGMKEGEADEAGRVLVVSRWDGERWSVDEVQEDPRPSLFEWVVGDNKLMLRETEAVARERRLSSVYVHPDGGSTVAWSTNRELRVRHYPADGPGVDLPSPTAEEAGVVGAAAMVEDAAGHLILAWNHYGVRDGVRVPSGIQVRRWTGEGWEPMGSVAPEGVLPSEMQARLPKLLLRADGSLVLGWVAQQRYGRPEVFHLRRWDGEGWVGLIEGAAEGPTYGLSDQFRLVFGSEDRLGVGWIERPWRRPDRQAWLVAGWLDGPLERSPVPTHDLYDVELRERAGRVRATPMNGNRPRLRQELALGEVTWKLAMVERLPTVERWMGEVVERWSEPCGLDDEFHKGVVVLGSTERDLGVVFTQRGRGTHCRWDGEGWERSDPMPWTGFVEAVRLGEHTVAVGSGIDGIQGWVDLVRLDGTRWVHAFEEPAVQCMGACESVTVLSEGDELCVGWLELRGSGQALGVRCFGP